MRLPELLGIPGTAEVWESTDGLPKNTVFLKKHINVAYEQTINLTNAFSAVIV